MNAKRFLLTGGRAPVTLDLARALRSQGHEVFMAESQPLFLSASSRAVERNFLVPAPNREPEQFAAAIERIVRDEKIDVVMPTCEEAFFVAKGKALISNVALTWVDTIEKLALLHSKWKFNQYAASMGFPVPSTRLCGSREEARAAVREIASNGRKAVLKPEFSRFASRTLIGTIEELDREITALDISEKRNWVVQEFLPGVEYCTYSLAYEGRLLAHVTYDHEFTAGKGAGICFSSVRIPQIEEWVEKFVRETKFTGQLAFDFIAAQDGRFQPLECNPRATSGLHLLARNQDYLAALADPEQFSGQVIRPELGESGMIRLAMWIYGLPTLTSIRRGLNWFKTMFNAREVIFRWSDPLPFFVQFACFFQLIRLAKRSGVTPLEASTWDIEWNGN